MSTAPTASAAASVGRSSRTTLLRALTTTALLAAPAVADLDLSAASQRVDQQAAATTGKVRTAYAKLQKTLSIPDRPGLSDDFAKLQTLAKAGGGVLASDATLAAAVDAELAAGLDSLETATVDLVQTTAALDVVGARARCAAACAKSRRFAASATTALAGGRTSTAAWWAVRAAAAYDFGVALSTKFFAQQSVRTPTWSIPLQGSNGALLSVWTSPGPAAVVYAVGADDGTGPQFLRMGGEGWVRVPVAASGSLWWVSGAGGSVFASGSGGRVVRYDPATGVVTDISPGVNVTLFGNWGPSADDVWSVGGNEDGTLPRSALLHYDGAAWTSVPLAPEVNNRIIFKVWGAAADDVWVCGQAGLLMHFDGAAWTIVPSGTFESLFTIHGTAPTTAVGGTVSPALVEGDLNGFASPVQPNGLMALRGVFTLPDGTAWACGLGATVLHRDNAQWARVGGLPDAPARDFHTVRVDDGGGVWFAGGDMPRLASGVLFHYGPIAPPTTVMAPTAFSTRVAPIFASPSCSTSACHVAANASGGLDFTLDPSSLRKRLVNVPSSGSPLQRVLPGRPSQSYLWRKLEGSHVAAGGSGARMPPTSPYLSQADMDAVRAWILGGACDD